MAGCVVETVLEDNQGHAFPDQGEMTPWGIATSSCRKFVRKVDLDIAPAVKNRNNLFS